MSNDDNNNRIIIKYRELIIDDCLIDDMTAFVEPSSIVWISGVNVND